MTTFEDVLREQLAKKPRKGRRERRLLELIDSRPSARRTRVLARLERHARAFLVSEGAVGEGVGAIDWASIDWEKFFSNLLKLLLAILPLFI